MTNLRNAAGYSLIEVMVASLIMTMILGGLFGALDSTQTFYENYADNSDMRQNARVAIDTMATELRYAGYDIGDLTEAPVAGRRHHDSVRCRYRRRRGERSL